LHLRARFLLCNGESNPFLQLPVIRDAWVPWGGGRRPGGYRQVSSTKDPAPALGSHKQQQDSEAFLQS